MRGILAIPILIAILMFFNGCGKEDASHTDFKYNYFPTKLGTWMSYNVDSISYNDFYNPVKVDTFRFQIKEILKEEYEDNEGRIGETIERYRRESNSSDWKIEMVWHQVLTTNNAQRTEDNLRFIKLIFPPQLNKTWKGNAYLDYEDELNCDFLGDWDYEYTEVDAPKTINGFDFDSTLTVVQVDDSNLICRSFVEEIYAKNVGLIKMTRIRLWSGNGNGLNFNLPFFERAEKGYILRYELFDYGKE